MSAAQTVWLIVAREVTDRLRNKLYVVGTLLMALAAVGGIVLPGLLSDDAPDRYELGVVGDVPAAFHDVLAAGTNNQGLRVELVELPDRDAAVVAVTRGDVDAALLDAVVLMAEGSPDSSLAAAVEGALQEAQTVEQLAQRGLPDSDIAAVMAPRPPLRAVDPAGDETDPFGAQLVGFAATILLFAALTINSSSLLTGALEEKSSRVIEVLLGSVRPWQLLAGKVVAMTGLALAQLGLVIGAALAANEAVDAFTLPPATTATVAVSLVMLVIGFVFYAALYTVAGSMASSAEDAQGSAGPLNFLIIGAYFGVVVAVLPDPQGTWAQVLSYLPPTAPLTVPARVAFGAMPLWQVLLATGITLAGVVATVWVAARLYGASLLSGGKLTWRGAWRADSVT